MKKLLFLLLFIPLISFGQNKAAFKDGKYLDISQLVSYCQKTFNSESMKKTINTENYCKCFVEKFAKDFTYNELKNLIYYGQTEDARLFFESNQEVLMECISISLTKKEPIIDLELLNTKEGRRQVIEFVKPRILQDLPKLDKEWVLENVNIDNLVICYIEELEKTNLFAKALNNNLSSSDLQKVSEVLIGCIESNLK